MTVQINPHTPSWKIVQKTLYDALSEIMKHRCKKGCKDCPLEKYYICLSKTMSIDGLVKRYDLLYNEFA